MHHQLVFELITLTHSFFDIHDHLFVVVDALKVAREQPHYFLGICALADRLELAPHFGVHPHPLHPHLVQLLEIRVVIVEKTPELKVDKCCLFEQFEEFLLPCFQIELSDQIQKLTLGQAEYLLGEYFFELHVDIVAVVGEFLMLNLQQISQRELKFPAHELVGAVLDLDLRGNRTESIARFVYDLEDIVEAE